MIHKLSKKSFISVEKISVSTKKESCPWRELRVLKVTCVSA